MPAPLQLRVVASTLLLLVVKAAPGGWLQLRSSGAPPRQLERRTSTQCRSVAMRLMPPPALTAYEECFLGMMRQNSTHDWAVPGAEVHAQLKCWCQTNLSATMEDFGCCDAPDVYPMCSVKCEADCKSPLALECVQSCPSMCFEAAEFITDASLCKSCDWVKCWPVLPCLTRHAVRSVQNGTLQKTCHETDFRRKPELDKYWKCWYNAPKHSTHWNVLSAIINCICREDMQGALANTSCCESMVYGGGACGLECVPEATCVSQVAQTCVHSCQRKCPLLQVAPTKDCMEHCLNMDAPCRKYVSCRPPMPSAFVCDDGEWPQANSGCCVDETSGDVGCPKLCEAQHIWRLDRKSGTPWWARWYDQGDAIVAQCTCDGCPSTEVKAEAKLKKTVEEGLWDNGQIMLVDIARREGLKYGPNRYMQELMVVRNAKITEIMKTTSGSAELDRMIAHTNRIYGRDITIAARYHGDDLQTQKVIVKEEGSHLEYIVVPIVCAVLVLCALGCCCVMYYRGRAHSKRDDISVPTFPPGDHVVVGQPVAQASEAGPEGVQSGVPVTLTAPTKGMKGSDG